MPFHLASERVPLAETRTFFEGSSVSSCLVTVGWEKGRPSVLVVCGEACQEPFGVPRKVSPRPFCKWRSILCSFNSLKVTTKVIYNVTFAVEWLRGPRCLYARAERLRTECMPLPRRVSGGELRSIKHAQLTRCHHSCCLFSSTKLIGH